jgi:SAM-dependent methyltransferase
MTTEPGPGPSLYDALAPFYDAWQSANGMIPFALVTHAKLEPVIERWGRGAVRSFLDLGCGTGELLLALGRAHPDWRLAGLDASGPMLRAAAAKPGAARVLWARARVDAGAGLPFAGAFDAAGAFYDMLNHLPDEAALARALGAAGAALRPGGLLVFDLTNRLGFERWWRGTNRWVGRGWKIAIETTHDREAGVGRARIRLTSGGKTEVLTLVEREFRDADVEQALAAAGLAVEATERWSPFRLDAPGKTLWIARKRP